MQDSRVPSLGQEGPLEEEMATHNSIVAWEIPWTEEPGGLQSDGGKRVGHDLVIKQQQFPRKAWGQDKSTVPSNHTFPLFLLGLPQWDPGMRRSRMTLRDKCSYQGQPGKKGGGVSSSSLRGCRYESQPIAFTPPKALNKRTCQILFMPWDFACAVPSALLPSMAVFHL